MKNMFVYKTTLILGLLILGTGSLMAEKITITGIVSDENIKPLAGVSVTVRDRVTKTDADGKYSISANPSDTIVFSREGYVSQSIPVKNRKEINVLLQPASSTIDEQTSILPPYFRQEAIGPKRETWKKEIKKSIP